MLRLRISNSQQTHSRLLESPKNEPFLWVQLHFLRADDSLRVTLSPDLLQTAPLLDDASLHFHLLHLLCGFLDALGHHRGLILLQQSIFDLRTVSALSVGLTVDGQMQV